MKTDALCLHRRSFRNRLGVFSLALLTLAAVTENGRAASATWTGTASTGNWTDSTWNPSTPGATSGTSSADVATFTSAGNSTITVDMYRNIAGISFTGTSAYTLTGGNFYLTSAGSIADTSSAAQEIDSGITLEGNYTFSNSATSTANTLDFTGAITQGLNSAVGGSSATGVLTLAGTNTGMNTVSGSLTNGSGGGILTVTKTNAGTWYLTGSGDSYSGYTNASNGLLYIETTLSGSTKLDSGSGGSFNETSAGSYTFSTGSVSVGSGTNYLYGSNTYTGGTTIATGTLYINTLSDNLTSSLGDSTGGGNNTIGDQTGGVLIFNGTAEGSTARNISIGNSGGTASSSQINEGGTTYYATIENDSPSPSAYLDLTGALTNAGVSGSGKSGVAQLQLQGSNTGPNTITAAIADKSTTTGGVTTAITTSITKSGTGFWELTGASTYSAGTYINEGTLDLANTVSTTSATGTGAVTLQGTSSTNPAVLAGTGYATGLVTATGGSAAYNVILPASTTTIGTLTLKGGVADASNSGLTMAFSIDGAGATNSQLALGTGNLTVGGNLVFDFYDLGSNSLVANTPYTIVTGSGTSSITSYSSVFIGSTNYQLNSSYGTNGILVSGDTISFEVAAAPEPRTWALLVVGMGFLFLRGRRMAKVRS